MGFVKRVLKKTCKCSCRACRDGNCWMCPDGAH